MLTRSLQIAVLLTLSSFALAQKPRQQSATAAPDTTNCAATFTSGSGHIQTKYCVTVNGNIVQFSRGGEEYIRVGDFSEGYGICDIDANVSYFDYADGDSGNWSPATFSSTGTKAISTRVTRDGFFQITNTITKIPANAAGPGSAKVTMKIQNLSSKNRTLILLRYADVDFTIEGVADSDDFNNDFDYTTDTAFGLEPSSRGGLTVASNSFNFEHFAYAQNTSSGPDPCNPTVNAATHPFFGDGSVVQAYAMSMPKLAVKTINVTYKPF
jgi:hypothetical protein